MTSGTLGMLRDKEASSAAQDKKTLQLLLDKEATVAHSGYTCKDGQVFEKPHACPQSTQYDGRDFTKLKCSGDMTVPLWSLRAPAQW